VLFGIVLGTGEPLTWYWLLIIPALLLQAAFNMGAGLIIARVGAGAQDVTQLVPFLLRVWRYFCGVMYSIAALPATLPEWAKNVISLNPAAVYISLTRYAIMATYRADAPGAQPYNAARCAIFNLKKVPSMQAYCHPEITINQLWLAGIGWAVVTIIAGALFFWQAETRYGRG
jgi:ABC-type polysaccharide/polyol phosphate export permease